MENTAGSKQFSRRRLLHSSLVLGAGAIGAAALAGCGEDEAAVPAAPATTAAPAAVATTVAAAAAQKTAVTLVLWTADNGEDYGPAFKQTLKDYEAKAPHVTVDATLIPFADIELKQITSLAAGDAPDLGYTHSQLNATFALKSILQPLDEFMKNDSGFDRADFFDGPLSALSFRGKIYGMPQYSGPVIFVYNKEITDGLGLGDPWELFEQGEWTIDKYDEIVKAGTSGSGADKVFGGNEIPNALKVWYLWLWGRDNTVWNDTVTESLMHEDSAVAAWEWMAAHENDETWAAGAALSSFAGGAEGMFKSHKLVVYLAARWVTTNIPNDFPAATAPMYKMPNGDDTDRDGTDGIAIHAKAKAPEEAWQLIKHLGTDFQELLLAVGYTSPWTRSALNSAAWKNSIVPWDNIEAHNAAAEQVRRGFYQPPGYNEINTLVKNAYKETTLGQKSAKDAFTAIKSEVDSILQESAE